MTDRIDWERVEPGLDLWETCDGYRRTVEVMRGEQVFVVSGPGNCMLFTSPDPDQLDECVKIHRKEEHRLASLQDYNLNKVQA